MKYLPLVIFYFYQTAIIKLVRFGICVLQILEFEQKRENIIHKQINSKVLRVLFDDVISNLVLSKAPVTSILVLSKAPVNLSKSKIKRPLIYR